MMLSGDVHVRLRIWTGTGCIVLFGMENRCVFPYITGYYGTGLAG